MTTPIFYREEAQREEESKSRRIYLVTDGLKSQHSCRVYQSAFNLFLKHLNLSSSIPDLQTLIDTKQSALEQKIIGYIEYLKDTRHLTYGTIKLHVNAILHFFEMNDDVVSPPLNTKKIKRFLPENESYHNDRPYSIPEIQQLLEKADIRSKALILLLATTGIRVGAVPGLRISDLKYVVEFKLYLIWIYNFSRRDRYYTYCTPECADAIKAYFKYRERLGEQLKDSSPLIRNKITVDNPFTTQVPKPIGTRAIQEIIEGLQKEVGIIHKKGELMLCHGFRKNHISTLDRAGIQFSTREYLSGHHLPNQDASYIRATEEDRLKEYAKAIPLLTFDRSIKLQEQVQELQKQQHVTKEEWDLMKTEMDRIKTLLILLKFDQLSQEQEQEKSQ